MRAPSSPSRPYFHLQNLFLATLLLSLPLLHPYLFPFSSLQFPPEKKPPSLQIFLYKDALVSAEGLGAVISGLKPVLLLANFTNAKITTLARTSSHGYTHNDLVKFEEPIPNHLRVTCNLTKDLDNIIALIRDQCQQFNYSQLSEWGLFQNGCNSVTVSRYLVHPRNCLAHTAPLVREFTSFKYLEHPKEDICVMRRGGDVEKVIRAGKGNIWAIDEEYTLPLLKTLSETRRVVVVTEIRNQDRSEVQRNYSAHVLSDRESLGKVVDRLNRCRCTFVAAGSSFGAAMMQITNPQRIIYMVNRTGFASDVSPYNWDEFGDRALKITESKETIIEHCK